MTTQTLDSTRVASIEAAVQSLLELLGYANALVHSRLISQGERPTLALSVTVANESRLLIGNHGSHLAALQHLVRCIARRQDTVAGLHVTLDINGYRARRELEIAQLAATAARRATQTGQTVSLEPMHALDRRAAHAALAGRADIQTESVGLEPNRRVLVKPIFV